MTFDFHKCIKEGVAQALEECKLTIGMTLKEAVEKQIPKKPKDYPLSDGQCPSCNAVFEYDWRPKSRFCQNCGQALDWSENNDR